MNVLYPLFVWLSGALLIRGFRQSQGALFCACFAFTAGIAVWTFAGSCFLMLGVPLTTGRLACAVIAVGLVLPGRTIGYVRADLRVLSASVLAVVFITILANQWNLTSFTYDSIRLLEAAETLFRSGTLSALERGGPTSYGVGIALLQFPARAISDGDYLAYIQPLVWTSLVAAFAWLLSASLATLKIETPSRWALVTLATLCLFSAKFIFFQAFYIHTNMPTSLFVFIALGTVWLARARSDESLLGLAGIALGITALFRPEGVCIFLLFAAVVVSEPSFSSGALRKFLLPPLVFLTLWQNYLRIQSSNTAGDIWTQQRAELALIAFCLSLPLAWFASSERARKLRPLLPGVVLCGLVVALLAASFDDPQLIGRSISALSYHAFAAATWGTLWILIAFLALCARIYDRSSCDALLWAPLPIYALFMLMLSYARDAAYHTSWGDSGNRMLTHVAVFAFFAASIAAGKAVRNRTR